MLREEVLKGWGRLKEKINQVKLTPSDKKIVKYLDESGLFVFYASSIKDEDLDEAEKKFTKIKDEINGLNPKNDLVIDYWCIADSFVSLILCWINLKIVASDYRFTIKDKNEKLEEKSEIIKGWISYIKDMIRDLKEYDNVKNNLSTEENFELLKAAIGDYERELTKY